MLLRKDPVPGKSGPNLLINLKNIPELEITKFKAYQHRTQEWQEAGTYDIRITKGGRVYSQRGYNVIIKSFPAWRIGFRYRSYSTINIVMNFSVYDKYGLVGNPTKTYHNLRPKEPVEIIVVQGKWRTRLKMESVQVYEGDQLVSSTEINSFLPPRSWRLLKSFFIVFLLGLLAVSSNEHATAEYKGGELVLSVFAFFISIWELFNITAVILMLILMIFVPFAIDDLGEKSLLLGLGLLYLWAVWNKRYSLKDFLIGAFIAKYK